MRQDTRYKIQDIRLLHRASCIMHQRALTYYFLPLFLFLAVCYPSSDAYAQVAGKITNIMGRVDILRTGSTTAVQLNVGETVSIGDIVRTKSDGKVEITFVDDSVMTVGPKSRLGVEEYLYKPGEGKRQASLKLYRGKSGFSVPKPIFPAEGSKFEMKTRTAVAGVRGTKGILYSEWVERVYVKEGIVEFSNPLGAVSLNKGDVGEVVHGKHPIERPFLDKDFQKREEDIKIDKKAGAGKPQSPVTAGGDVPPPPVVPVTTAQDILTTTTTTSLTDTGTQGPPPLPITDVTPTGGTTNVGINVIFP